MPTDPQARQRAEDLLALRCRRGDEIRVVACSLRELVELGLARRAEELESEGWEVWWPNLPVEVRRAD